MRSESTPSPTSGASFEPAIKYPSRSTALLDRLTTATAAQDNLSLKAAHPLNVLIVGAGLGGLSTAVALARRGHKVTVLERAPVLGEVGAGIQIPPNSARLLLSWGIAPHFAARVVEPASISFRRWATGDVIGHTPLVPDFRSTYGAPYYVIHRADFHSALCALATELGVKIVTGCEVVGYEGEERGEVRAADGRVFGGDLVIAADGVRSVARGVVLGGEDRPAERTGFAAYRAVVETELMRGDADMEWLLERPSLNVWIGEDRHVMTYTIAGGKTFNLVLSHVDRTDPSTWKPETAVEDMKEYFRGWDPKLTKIIDLIKDTIKWPLLSGNPLPTWTSKSKNLVILGDAAHAMVPYMSQGAAMAVEDGAALAELLSLIESKEQIPDALRIFEAERMKRSGGMQSASLVNGKLWHFPDGPQQEARDAGMRAEVEGKPFVESTNQWSDPVTQLWAYGYDAEKVVRELWLAERGVKA